MSHKHIYDEAVSRLIATSSSIDFIADDKRRVLSIRFFDHKTVAHASDDR